MLRDYRDYLDDIVTSCDKVQEYTRGMDSERFVADDRTLRAVIHCMLVIGEATKKLPLSLRRGHPDIPWKRLAGMRDKLIHEYFGIDTEILWKAVQEDIPILRERAGRIQAGLAE